MLLELFEYILVDSNVAIMNQRKSKRELCIKCRCFLDCYVPRGLLVVRSTKIRTILAYVARNLTVKVSYEIQPFSQNLPWVYGQTAVGQRSIRLFFRLAWGGKTNNIFFLILLRVAYRH